MGQTLTRQQRRQIERNSVGGRRRSDRKRGRRSAFRSGYHVAFARRAELYADARRAALEAVQQRQREREKNQPAKVGPIGRFLARRRFERTIRRDEKYRRRQSGLIVPRS